MRAAADWQINFCLIHSTSGNAFLLKLLLIQKKHGQKQLRTFYKPFFYFLFLTGLSEPGSISKIT